MPARRQALERVATPTADAMQRGLSGRPFAEQTAAARAQLLALRDSDVRPVSVIMRRPLGRILDRLETASRR